MKENLAEKQWTGSSVGFALNMLPTRRMVISVSRFLKAFHGPSRSFLTHILVRNKFRHERTRFGAGNGVATKHYVGISAPLH